MSSEVTDVKHGEIKPEFSVKYYEDKQVIRDLLEVFHIQKAEMSTLIVIALVGTALLIINLLYADPGGGTAAGLAWFLVKYLSIWAAVFFAGDIVARTFFRRLMVDTAIGDAEELYRVRVKRRKEPLCVRVSFYEDRIVNDTGSKQAIYLYSKIHNVLETDKAIGFLAKNGAGPKNFFGVPKSALADKQEEKLKEFLLERCPKVKKVKRV